VEAREQLKLRAEELETAVTERTKELQETVGDLSCFVTACHTYANAFAGQFRAFRRWCWKKKADNIGPDCTGYLRKGLARLSGWTR